MRIEQDQLDAGDVEDDEDAGDIEDGDDSEDDEEFIEPAAKKQ